MSQPWTGEEIEYLGANLNHPTGVLVSNYRDSFGSVRTYNSLQKKIKQLRDALSDEDTDTTETPLLQEGNQIELDLFIQAGEPTVPVVVSAAEKKAARLDAEQWLKELLEVTKKEMTHIGGIAASGAVNSNNTSLVVLLSDNHFGKKTRWFDMKIAAERMRSIPINIKANCPEVDEVVLVLAGDMIEGEDIYPNQNGGLECSVIEQTTEAGKAIWEAILLFRKLFNCPVRVETCPGNHGRMSKTANEKSNWDNVVYHIIRLLASMEGDKDIKVNCNFEKFVTFKVKDKVGMAYHHGVKHTGTPAMQTRVTGWSKTKQFDFMVHGHWHEWHVGNVLGKLVIGNGCMCGPDDLAEVMGVEDNPRQGYFFVTPGKPVWGFSFCEWPLDY